MTAKGFWARSRHEEPVMIDDAATSYEAALRYVHLRPFESGLRSKIVRVWPANSNDGERGAPWYLVSDMTGGPPCLPGCSHKWVRPAVDIRRPFEEVTAEGVVTMRLWWEVCVHCRSYRLVIVRMVVDDIVLGGSITVCYDDPDTKSKAWDLGGA